jgi:hypothetical protein
VKSDLRGVGACGLSSYQHEVKYSTKGRVVVPLIDVEVSTEIRCKSSSR